jgi:hypothetical protein
MIVEPDFLTHWKTQMLISELGGDKRAPLYVIALWAYCQQRKVFSFHAMAPKALKAICCYEGEANKLLSALTSSGWLDAEGDLYVVHGWAETNASLVANWRNGERGGRPRAPNSVRSIRGDYDETQTKPRRNPAPKKRNPDETDKRREEKRREDNNPSPLKPPKGGADSQEAPSAASPDLEPAPEAPAGGHPAQNAPGPPTFPPPLDTDAFRAAWADWMAYRQERRLRTLLPRSVSEKLAEMAAWGEPAAIAAVRQSIGNGWQGIFPPDARFGTSPPGAKNQGRRASFA